MIKGLSPFISLGTLLIALHHHPEKLRPSGWGEFSWVPSYGLKDFALNIYIILAYKMHAMFIMLSIQCRYIYTTVLDVLGKAKRPFEALNVFYTMQVQLVLIFALWLCKPNLTLFICHLQNQLSSYPDMAAYHCIAVTLGQAGLIKELFDVIDCMCSPPRKKFKLSPLQNSDPRLEPDLIVYNAVSNICTIFYVELPNWII
jgi:pentatricopeptide repeat protein